MHKVISFYKYVDVQDPEQLRDTLRAYCEANNILGRILLGKEGLNGAVSGTKDAIEAFKIWIKENKLFQDLTFRKQDYQENSFHKLVVRIRDEICAFGEEVNLENKGEYITPQQLETMYQNQEDFVIVDARNDYEFDIGKFKNAVKLPIQNFREFKDVAPKVLEDKKDKKIVLYCTGGIRCEKASAFMKEQGFENTFHVKGGIINYVNQFPDSNWEGGLFVFDDRVVSDVSQALADCIHCQQKSNQMTNCHNLDCDKLMVICDACQEEWNKTCSQDCKEAPRQRQEKVIDNRKQIGVVENYFAKNKVAVVRLFDEFSKDTTIGIKGKTTNINVTVQELRDADGNSIETAQNQLVSFPCDKVRKNDKVLV